MLVYHFFTFFPPVSLLLSLVTQISCILGKLKLSILMEHDLQAMTEFSDCAFARHWRPACAVSTRRRCGPASTSSTPCGPWAWSRTWPCPPSPSSGTRARARAPCWRRCRASPSPEAAVSTCPLYLSAAAAVQATIG